MISVSTSTCSKCKETKDVSLFYYRYGRPRGTCKACNPIMKGYKEYMKSYAIAHKEELAEKRAAYYQKNKQLLNAKSRAYALAHTEARHRAEQKYRDAHRAECNKRIAEWGKKNPLKRLAMFGKRRAQKRACNAEKFSYDEILKRDGWTCHICKFEIRGREELHFDHVIPLSRGGAHSMENVKPSHATCNMKKGSKVMSN